MQAHYRLSGPAARLAEGDPTAQAQILQGAVKQLKGKLWKKARQLPQFHERTVWVDDLQLKYANRARQIQNKLLIAQDPVQARIADLLEQVETLIEC